MHKISLAIVAAILTLVSSTFSVLADDRWNNLPEFPAMPKADTTGFADVNGIKMYYATFGKGDPILLIHGGLGFADVWANQIADLSKDHMVIVADSRGHGRSTRTAEPFGYDLMTADYVALLDYLRVPKVTLVGWSDGGIIGIDMAMKNPEHLNLVVAHAANVTVDGVIPTVMENKTFATYIEKAGEVYKKISPTPTEYDAFVTQISGMWNSQPSWTPDMLGKITVPITIVLGDHDEAIKLDHTEKMAKDIPGSKLVILKDASHFAMLQDPEGYTKMIRDAMAGQ